MPATMTINDAIDALNNAVKRATAEADAANAVSTAKTQLVLSKDARSVFFASLALRLYFKADWSIDTAATDGRRLLYNPDFVLSLPREERIGLLAHEVMHCVLKHFARRGERELGKANIAMDLAINPLLIDAGFQLPACGLFPGQGDYKDLPSGLSFEEYFARLPAKQPDPEGDGSGQPGDGTPDPGGCGGVIDAQDPEGTPADAASAAQLDAEWSVNIAAAQQAAKRRGTLSAGLERVIGEALAPKADWRAALREFITRPAKRDYNWKRQNRRHIHAGLYLPSLHSLELGEIVIAIDTSGSITPETLQRFAGEIADIAATGANKITTLYHDSDVVKVETWTPDDGPFTLTPCGGGGTSHKPVFDWIEANDEEPPAVLVCLTDLASDFPPSAPDYPTLWASTDSHARHPFGERLDIPAE